MRRVEISEVRRRLSRAWRLWTLLTTPLVLLGPGPVHAQACTLLPGAYNEVWVGAFMERGGPSPQRGGELTANVLDLVALEFGASWGGYEGAEGGSETRIRLSSGFGSGGGSVCPYLELRTVEYPFRRAFDLDWGDVAENAVQLGLGFGGVPWRSGSLALSWRANVGGYYRKWDMWGRRLIVDESSLEPEEVRRVDHSYHLALAGAATVVWEGVAVTAGIGNRPRYGDDTLAWVAVGLRALRLGR